MHQTFLGVLETQAGIRGETSFRRYLYAIARNVLNVYIRKKYKRQRETADFAELCVHALAPASPSSLVAGRRQAQAFVEALRRLPLHDQLLLELRYFSAQSSREIAELLAVAEPTLRGQLARGVERLRVAPAELIAAPDAASEVTLAELAAWSADLREQLGWPPGPLDP